MTAMLEDPDPKVKQFGVNLIRKSRQSPPKPPKMKALKGMRKHKVPDLNWEAESWEDIINWKKITVWEPRILEKLTMQGIKDAVLTPISFPKYPCHAQTVERMVKLVTESSSSVYGEDKIVAVLASRKSRKSYDTKKYYVVKQSIVKHTYIISYHIFYILMTI
jgi:hypothetical protein